MVRTWLLVVLLGASALVACKKQEEEPAYPPAGPAPEAPAGSLEQAPADEAPAFTSIEEAQAAFARAEQDLLTLRGGPAAPATTPPAATAPAEPDRSAEPAPEEEAEPAPKRKDDKGGADRCSGLCQAFGSLSRAADAICRLAGEADERCTRARGSVRDNFQRVAVCRCPPL